MKRITITLLLTLALALPIGAQDKPKKPTEGNGTPTSITIVPSTAGTGVWTIPPKPTKKPYTARQAAMELLRLANKISDSDLKGKDEIAELAEMLSAKLLEKNHTWLCSTDAECAKLEAKLK